ncbi:MAG: magnesium transporter [Gammaproteobacteria bacterium]|nr:magnesium transporter [Gammaproteobacteria bacterium]
MPETTSQEQTSERLQAFFELIRGGDAAQLVEKLDELHPGEIAHLLKSLPREDREKVWALVDLEQNGDVLLLVNDEIRSQLIKEADNDQLVAAAQTFDTDDLADIIVDLPEDVTSQVLQSLDEQHRLRLEAVLSYPEDSAGRLMNTDTINVREDLTLDVVLRYLRILGKVPEMTDNLIVTDREGKYLGAMLLTDLLTKNANLTVSEIMSRETEAIPATMSARDAANLFEQRDLVSAPVVDENNKLLGRITIDDVVDVIRDEADHSLMSMAGLSEEDDMFAPVVRSSRRRTVWLGINLLTALLASWVIGHFEDTIEKLVALAVLMPVVASMGGIAGSQTLTLVIRGIATGQVASSNARRLLNKEFAVGILNGMVWALVVGLIALFWFEDTQLSVIIGIAILVNLIVAALAGATIPMMLNKIGVDPALAGGVVLTTVTDVVGFLAFLGLAAMLIV